MNNINNIMSEVSSCGVCLSQDEFKDFIFNEYETGKIKEKFKLLYYIIKRINNKVDVRNKISYFLFIKKDKMSEVMSLNGSTNFHTAPNDIDWDKTLYEYIKILSNIGIDEMIDDLEKNLNKMKENYLCVEADYCMIKKAKEDIDKLKIKKEICSVCGKELNEYDANYYEDNLYYDEDTDKFYCSNECLHYDFSGKYIEKNGEILVEQYIKKHQNNQN